MRMQPHRGLSFAIWMIRAIRSGSSGGRPILPCRYVHFLATSSRCQRRIVWGETMKHDQRALGTSRAKAARSIRSSRRSFGLPVFRLKTAS